jgi:hypothetical protein
MEMGRLKQTHEGLPLKSYDNGLDTVHGNYIAFIQDHLFLNLVVLHRRVTRSGNKKWLPNM